MLSVRFRHQYKQLWWFLELDISWLCWYVRHQMPWNLNELNLIAIFSQAVVPPWPMYRKHPVTWLPPRRLKVQWNGLFLWSSNHQSKLQLEEIWGDGHHLLHLVIKIRSPFTLQFITVQILGTYIIVVYASPTMWDQTWFRATHGVYFLVHKEPPVSAAVVYEQSATRDVVCVRSLQSEGHAGRALWAANMVCSLESIDAYEHIGDPIPNLDYSRGILQVRMSCTCTSNKIVDVWGCYEKRASHRCDMDWTTSSARLSTEDDYDPFRCMQRPI